MPTGVYLRTEETKKKMSESKKGKSGWNKGKKLLRLSGENNGKWKGGKTKTVKGYIELYCPNHPFAYRSRYVLEHRLVIERIIGRYLLSKEEVHHLGNRDDNRPFMLMAFINHSVHIRFEKGKPVKPEEIIFDGRNYKDRTQPK